MSPKKKKQRPEVAQQLIDSLLDEKAAPKQAPKAAFSKNDSDDSSIDIPNEVHTGQIEFSNPKHDENFRLTLDKDESNVTRMAQEEEGIQSIPEISLDDSDEISLDEAATHMQVRQSSYQLDADAVSDSDFAKSFQPLVIDDDEVDPIDGAVARAIDNEQNKLSVDDEPTMKLSLAPKPTPTQVQVRPQPKPQAAKPSFEPTEIRTSLKGQQNQAQSPRPYPQAFSSSEAALKQSENLRIAQSRITDLETELERLRRDNDELASAGDAIRRRSDELLSKAESIETQARESKRIFEEEKKVLRGQLQGKERENAELKSRLEEIEARLENGFKKIRVRERELEHRLEIVKIESATLVSAKDRMILELKRQIDQLGHENDSGKQKSQELFSQYKEKQETIRRVVRALRIALTILEGDEDAVVPLKKAE